MPPGWTVAIEDEWRAAEPPTNMAEASKANATNQGATPESRVSERAAWRVPVATKGLNAAITEPQTEAA